LEKYPSAIASSLWSSDSDDDSWDEEEAEDDAGGPQGVAAAAEVENLMSPGRSQWDRSKVPQRTPFSNKKRSRATATGTVNTSLDAHNDILKIIDEILKE
jgi:hypothetical protein